MGSLGPRHYLRLRLPEPTTRATVSFQICLYPSASRVVAVHTIVAGSLGRCSWQCICRASFLVLVRLRVYSTYHKGSQVFSMPTIHIGHLSTGLAYAASSSLGMLKSDHPATQAHAHAHRLDTANSHLLCSISISSLFNRHGILYLVGNMYHT